MPLPQVLNQPVTVSDGTSPVLPLLARTTAQSVDCVNLTGAGIEVILNITVNAASAAALTLVIRSRDPISGLYMTILSSIAVSAVGRTRYRVYPGIAVVANQTASDVIPHDFNIQITVADANPATYSVAASIIP